MKRYAIEVADTGDVVWLGNAEDAMTACTRAAREGNPNVGPFVPHVGSTQDDYDLKHLVLNVYDVSDLDEGATLTDLQTHGAELDEDRQVGTFAARYED